MEIVNIHAAKTRLSELIQMVLKGEKVIIANNNIPVVTLLPYKPELKIREFGTLKGQITISEDCWVNDQEMEDTIYNGPIFPDENLT